jgi:CDP-diacylglycerol---glycerol-3-phosphate 3-phosphatidyltransferase
MRIGRLPGTRSMDVPDMPSLYSLKPGFQKLLQPLCRLLRSAGATPNQITVATLLASGAMGGWLYLGRAGLAPFVALPFFLLLRMAANALDGMMAREYGMSSARGAILNEAGDVLADAALYLPFAALRCVAPLLPVAAVIGATATEAVALAASGGPRRNDGPMGKSDRALAFGLFSVLYAAGMRDARIWNTAFSLMLALLAITVANRVRGARRELCR